MPESKVTPEYVFDLICKGICHFDRNTNGFILEQMPDGSSLSKEDKEAIGKCVYANFKASIRQYFPRLTEEGQEHFHLLM